MVRKLTMAVALALGSASFTANGLGLGDIETSSGLNEPFNAKIGLLSVGADELEGLRVKLASNKDFERAGVGRPLFLNELRFKPIHISNGNAVIEVSSDFPIREPFLNFLIEVNWPNGRLIREYTVLLDPPATTMRRPPEVSAPAVTQRSAAPARPVTRPAPASRPAPTRQESAAGEYGPVQANETMWTIASNLRPSDVSTEQMIIAIQRANPDAFINGNVNLLKKGQILRIPQRDEILGIGLSQARSEFLAQQDDWLSSLQRQLPKGAETAPAEAAESDAAAQLRIATPRPEGEGKAGAAEDDAARATSDDLEQELILTREKAESSRQETDNLRGQVDELEEQINDMQRLLSLKDEQLAQLQASVQQQQEVAVQPEPVPESEPETAQEQKTESAVQEETEVAVATPPEEATPAPGESAPTTEAGASDGREEVAPAEVAEAETPADETAEAPAAADAPVEAPAVTEPVAEVTPTAEKSAAGLYDPATVKTPEPEPAPPPAAVEPDPAPKAPPKAWYTELPVVGGIAAVALALLGWLFTRRKQEEAPVAEGELTEAPPDSLAATDEVPLEPDTMELAEAVAASESESDSLPMVDDAAETERASALESVQDDTGEVDPVSEADVYIAYGRYQQAEELLRQALGKEPDRLAYKHKLLEVLYATKKGDAFSEVAQGMTEQGQDGVDPEAWVRVQEMGRDLDPDSVLFQPERDAPVLAAVPERAEAVRDGEGLDAGDEREDEVDELSELVSELKLDDAPVSAPTDALSEDDLSLQLDELTREVEESIEGAADQDSSQLKADDLESLALDLPTVHADERTLGQMPDAGDEEMETLELPEDSLETPTQAVEDAEDIPSLLTEDLTRADSANQPEMDSQLEDLSELTTLDTQVDEQPEDSAGLEPLDLDTVFDQESISNTEEPAQEASALTEGVGDEVTADIDLGEPVQEGDGFDDVETKLDLARAYVEMGDADGARSILDEVSEEGDDNQKSQAKQILAEIEA